MFGMNFILFVIVSVLSACLSEARTVLHRTLERDAARTETAREKRAFRAPGGDADERDPIIQSRFKDTTIWGVPSYHRQLDADNKLRSWERLARDAGNVGRNCSVENANNDNECGYSFVCKEGICRECEVSRECNEKYECLLTNGDRLPNRDDNVFAFGVSSETGKNQNMRAVCMPRDPVRKWSWREVVCTIFVVITAVLSAAAGMGGGGVYVPLLLMILDFSTKEAVPLSQAMIVGGAAVNVAFALTERHPLHPEKPRIDWNVIMMLNPGLAAGVSVGIIMHMISPQWLIVLVLLVTLAIALQKSLQKGMQSWAKESAKLTADSATGSAGAALPPPPSSRPHLSTKYVDDSSSSVLRHFAGGYQKQMILVVGCWATFFSMNLLKAPQCTVAYWFQQFAMVGICAAFTFAGAKTLESTGQLSGCDDQIASTDKTEMTWSPTALRLYPLFATVAGMLGGFLGIGGGIIMGPLLLELGLVPQASQATTAVFVLLSSSLATIQFMILGKEMPIYSLWFTSWVLVATLIGQTAVEYALRRWQRPSVIVLSVAAIIAGSLVMMTAIGLVSGIDDYQRGATDWGFSPHELCHQA